MLLLSQGFCCDCCCDVRLILKDGPQTYWDADNHRLPGLEVKVGEGCTLCGTCQNVCLGGERIISMGKHQAEINDHCLGCGLCVEACPQHVISIEVQSFEDTMNGFMERISRRTDIQKHDQ